MVTKCKSQKKVELKMGLAGAGNKNCGVNKNTHDNNDDNGNRHDSD